MVSRRLFDELLPVRTSSSSPNSFSRWASDTGDCGRYQGMGRHNSQRTLAPLAILLFGALATSCASDKGAATTTTTATTAATAPPTTTATSSAATMSTGFFGGAHSAACDTDLDLVQTAVESYLAINGGTEVTEAQLVQQGVMREESTLHDIGPGATVIPSPAGGCIH